jgi:hypothetical protein
MGLCGGTHNAQRWRGVTGRVHPTEMPVSACHTKWNDKTKTHTLESERWTDRLSDDCNSGKLQGRNEFITLELEVRQLNF